MARKISIWQLSKLKLTCMQYSKDGVMKFLFFKKIFYLLKKKNNLFIIIGQKV